MITRKKIIAINQKTAQMQKNQVILNPKYYEKR